MTKVFVYGTLKPEQTNYRDYCEGKIIESIEAYTFGRLFAFPALGYPAMVEVNNTSEKVRGYLFTFADATILEDLDELECYSPQNLPEVNEYQRRSIVVYTLTDEPIEGVWAYFMTPNKVELQRGILVPSGCWNA